MNRIIAGALSTLLFSTKVQAYGAFGSSQWYLQQQQNQILNQQLQNMRMEQDRANWRILNQILNAKKQQTPTPIATATPTIAPTRVPTRRPTQRPTSTPTLVPTSTPTPYPSVIIEQSPIREDSYLGKIITWISELLKK